MRLTQNNTSSGREYLMIILVTAIFAAFMVWANYTQLDLVTRGNGRVIADGQNKNIQSPERGTIATYVVEEGSAVNAGQIIATINPIEAEGVLEELEARLSNLRLKMIRLEAELNGGTIASVRNNASSYPETLLDAEIKLMTSRRESLNAELKTLNQDKERKGKVLLGLGAEIKGQNSLKALLNKEMLEVLPLVDAGVLGSSERFRLEREDTSIQTQLQVLSQKVAQTKLEIEQVVSQLQSVQINYNTEIYQERSQVTGEIAELEVRLPAIRQRLKETEIRSPIDGIVNRVFFNSLGAVVSSGEVIAEIVPTQGKLLVEAFIDPKDIATIEPGQPAKISLTAYDPSKYGYLLGTLTKVSADTVFREETKSSAYAINLSIDTEIYESDDVPVSIVPGMIAQVDIIRGERTILEYFWQPVAKMKDTAFRE
ncbi:HlyD family type I secretion periplasmic adaptor subunit [bacterium]|jgi:adhesin transport system membrane fusion protein|nr:HlyD family type I secretion periplasmic adaptor subunit [bacterium]|tara:strand:+ start:322 stop:1605 length:1284 start_codon:yes stop_codon:yes gene_type:complete